MPQPHNTFSAARSLVLPGIGLIIVLALGLFGAHAPLDRAWFDFLQRRSAGQAPLPADTAIVLIDEQSLRAMSGGQFAMRWPWPRGAFGAMFAALHRAGATSIAADLIFFESSEDPNQDLVLGAAAAGLPEVVLGALPASETQPAKLPVIWPEDFRAAHASAFDKRPRWGFVRPETDRDGVNRRYLLGGSLAEVALGRAQHGDMPSGETTLLRWRGDLETLRARGVPLLAAAPFVAAGLDLLNQATEAAPDFDPVALARAIDEQPVPEGEIFAAVRGKRVFVGANAAATHDFIATPVGASQPGVLLHWTALASLEAGDTLLDSSRAPAGTLAELALLLVIAGGIVHAGRGGLSLQKPVLASVAGVAIVAGGSLAGFVSGFWLAPAWPVIGAFVMFTAVAAESFRLERARKQQIQGWFGSYVSPTVVKRLVENPDALRLGGERREVSVLFSDLVGFTSLSEKLPADQLVTLVNACLDEQSQSIFEHTGYIDKYIGDAVMAVFGSPEDLENHALAATRTALDSQRRLAALNERFEREHGVRLGMRIGINTGEAVVGNVGSERKKNYTALGDTVNLASRLEGANKEFHTSILIGPLTAAHVAGEILTRPVALLRVKGKTQAVEVHEPLAPLAEADDATRRFAAACTEGFEAWCARRFEQAAAAFAEAADLRPGDFPVTRYLAEARRLSASPPPDDWQPTLILETK